MFQSFQWFHSEKISDFAGQILTVLTPKSSTVSILKVKWETWVQSYKLGTQNFLWWRQSGFQTFTQNNPKAEP